MDVRQLQVLRELGDLGSVRAVAEAMLVTPSAVSQQLALLQRSVDVPLTRREGRTLVLTDAGRVLADSGAAVIRAMADARAAIGAFHDDPAGTVALSAFHSAGQAVFSRLVDRLPPGAEGVPRLRLADEDVSQQEFPSLTARYDLVLAHRMANGAAWPRERVAVLPMIEEALDVALPAGHPLAERASLQPTDVVGEHWVTSRDGYSPADVLSAVVAVTGRPADVVHRINDYSAVAALVAAGGVIGLLPRYTARQAAGPSIVTRPLRGVNAVRAIDVLARPEAMRRRSVQTVAAALREILSEFTNDQEPV